MSDDATAYQVVVNDEEQHALWPVGSYPPAGWRVEGFAGSQEECVAHVDTVRRGVRPLGPRRRAEPAAPGGVDGPGGTDGSGGADGSGGTDGSGGADSSAGADDPARADDPAGAGR
ncbi:MbtH-like protein [Streptomyces sp. ADI96-02]|uniref:MbtH family protein n=1 Tax=Streptomyces sp. ADI96-02 TaxID=1522760 RepID=UPI000F557A63|nr:MbtH family protein [Streptomyces sp. ADI96-02]RPK63220.1 MbtH-like protein [Streptomyces sp. ADI96-02]